MEKYSFFNDINNDRIYFAEDFARHLKKYFTNGIFNNSLMVIANNDMTVTIQEGDANIEGYRYTNTGNLIKNIDNADGILKRIDNVVIRLDLTNRLISAQIIKGDFSDNPIAPELVRNSTIYDIKLGEIYIDAGMTSISQSSIKDTRFDSNVCGNVVGAVSQIDTTNVFNQYETMFNEWFSHIKEQLSEDVAGNLQNQIDTNTTSIKVINENAKINTLEYDETVTEFNCFFISLNEFAEKHIYNVEIPLSIIPTDNDNEIKISLNKNKEYCYLKELDGNVNLKPSHLKNKYINIFFDGTDYRLTSNLKCKIKAGITADITKTTTKTGVCDMEKSSLYGTKLTIENGVVKVGSGVKRVNVWGSMLVLNNNASNSIDWQPYIKHTPINGTTYNVNTGRGKAVGSDYSHDSMTSIPVEVNEGDTFQLSWWKSNDFSLSILKGTATYLVVEVEE